MGARGRAYVQDIQRSLDFPEEFEQIVSMVVGAEPEGPATSPPDPPKRKTLTDLALESLTTAQREAVTAGDRSDPAVHAAAAAISFDEVLARATTDRDGDASSPDTLHRLSCGSWTLSQDEIVGLVPRWGWSRP